MAGTESSSNRSPPLVGRAGQHARPAGGAVEARLGGERPPAVG